MGGQRQIPQPQQGAVTQQQQQQPWSGIQPYMSNIYGLAKEQFRTQPVQTAGLGEDFQTGRDLIGRTAGGEYLYGGDAFNRALQAATNKIIPDVESRFAQGGRFGSGLARTAETGAIGDAFAGQYGQERQLQQQAQQMLPQLAEMQRQVEQRRMDAPFTRLQRYAGIVGGLPATESTSTGYSQPIYPGSQGAGILGGALGGAGLAQSLGSTIPFLGGPLGMGLGALGGGIAGRFL